MSASSQFQPNQILYLQHQSTRLYTELIQVIPERGVVWVRPLALVDLEAIGAGDEAIGRSPLSDLRQGADLLCPLSLFQAALDTEVIPVLAALEASKQQEQAEAIASEPNQATRRQLQDFIQQLWQSHPQAFQA